MTRRSNYKEHKLRLAIAKRLRHIAYCIESGTSLHIVERFHGILGARTIALYNEVREQLENETLPADE